MVNDTGKGEQGKEYDLAERTAKFGEAIIGFAKRIKVNDITRPLVGQIVSAATSVGANYCEADEAQSRKDFRHKIGTCKKESRETGFWIRMILAAQSDLKDDARPLWKESRELTLIFAAILRGRDGQSR
ncbi:MAG: four helix bundle protein [Planctomycetes bacterium]|nr:four helix bundle protein [Planctomycetota bacterium]